MIPVLYQFEFNTPLMQGVLYLFAVGLIAYIASQGWRGAHGPLNAKTQEYDSPSRDARTQRAVVFGAIGIGLAGVGLHYALPADAFLSFGGKGEGIPIHTYGVMLASGFIFAVTLAGELARNEWGRGEEGERKRNQIMDLAFYVLVGAIVGSRILFIIVNWKDYAAQPSKIFDLGGGLVFYGGLIGASLVSYWFAKKNGIEFIRLADVALPTVSLGQTMGRLGCFSAGCCWGRVAEPGMKFAVHFPGSDIAKNIFGGLSRTAALAFQSQAEDPRWVVESTGQIFHQPVAGAVRISEWVATHHHTLAIHPTQLYESIGQLSICLFLLTMRRYRRFKGQITGMWLMCYAILRSTVELFRGDLERGTLHGWLLDHQMLGMADKVPAEAWYNLSISQFISICMFTLGLTILYRQGRHLLFRGPTSPSVAPASA